MQTLISIWATLKLIIDNLTNWQIDNYIRRIPSLTPARAECCPRWTARWSRTSPEACRTCNLLMDLINRIKRDTDIQERGTQRQSFKWAHFTTVEPWAPGGNRTKQIRLFFWRQRELEAYVTRYLLAVAVNLVKVVNFSCLDYFEEENICRLHIFVFEGVGFYRATRSFPSFCQVGYYHL